MHSRARRTAATVLSFVTFLPFLGAVGCHRNLEEGITHKDDYQKAYIYAFPMIANYKAMYEFFIDKSSSLYKGPFNTVISDSHVFTPKDTAVVTPNADTPDSMLQADLRAEPIVFCVPDIEKSRYYSVQLIDMYTFNYGYVGSRSTGNVGGCYLVSGPGWRGITPPGVLKAFQSETQFSLLIFRTQLFGPNDIANVKKVQEGYTVTTLSQYTHHPPPPPPPAVNFPKYTEDDFKTDFPKLLNFLLQFCPEVPEETAIRLQFATIGIAPGKPFDFSKLSDGQKAELAAAVKDGYAQIQNQRNDIGKNINGWRVGSPFGNRDFYNGDNLRRAAAAMAGIYGNDAEEAMYPMAKTDGIGAPLDGSKHQYTLTFAPNLYPPVNAFWSVTMYDGKTQLLIENPINRYLINSPILPSLKKNADGSLTLYLQKDDPGPDKRANWLPAPNGPIMLVMRLYWPRKNPPPSILPPTKGTWDPPGIIVAK
ncbi:MAG TPA: DUF1254 domain-containing protein [Candidatus Binatia bacterium]|nr:DUF1254 domain-containing protein [Candidatus Binatia bacterium]